MEHPLRATDMLRDINSMRSRAIRFLGQGKSYEPLLQAITAKDFADLGYHPTIKELAAQAGMKYITAKNQLRQIYEDLTREEEDPVPFHFKSVMYNFYLKGYSSKTASFVTDHLPVVPRIGEEVFVPFFRGLMGTDFFYVEEVIHRFRDNLQIVDIVLNHGRYNKYWHIRKDQAREEGELNYNDFYMLDDESIKKKLKIGRYKH